MLPSGIRYADGEKRTCPRQKACKMESTKHATME